MDFLKILRSVEEFVYELVTWLILYPRTLWRVVRHPQHMATYVESERAERVEDQFSDLLSPVLFLILSLVLAHGVELATKAPTLQGGTKLSRMLVESEQNLLLMRAVLFSAYPLVMARGLLRRQSIRVDRETLRNPFYLQCYLAAPFALALSLASSCSRLRFPFAGPVATALAVAAVPWYLASVTLFIERRLALPRRRAAAVAGWLFAWATFGLLVVLVLLALTMVSA